MKNKKPSQTHANQPSPQSISPSFSLPSHYRWHGWFVFLIGVICYANTLNHNFAQDDAIVITDNMYTTKGIAGLGGIFSKDTFFGFFKTEGKANLVKGGRYRPLTPAMFALEYELVGKKPWLGHLMNILLYGLLCWFIHSFLKFLICKDKDDESSLLLVLAASVIYAVHPIHTEAVANIKGRDEIMAMMGSVGAAWFTLKYIDTKNIRNLIWASLCMFLGLLSKENTITFFAVIPLALYFFRKMSFISAIGNSLYLLIPIAMFFIIRVLILGFDFGDSPKELMNNPYLKLVNGQYVDFTFGEKLATIMYTLGCYIKLMLWPHPLTNDYYPRHVDIMKWTDPATLLSLFTYIGLAALVFWGWAKRHILAFGAAYYIVTLSIVSNIVFPIGTNMSERFMFMPSLGIFLMVAWALTKFVYAPMGKTALIGTLAIIALPAIGETISRNMVWVDDFTLFQTDVKVSNRSAKALNAAGGSLLTAAEKETDPAKKKAMYTAALGHLQKAIEVHPTYKNAYLIKGNAHYYLQEYEKAIKEYEVALQLDTEFADAQRNLAVSLTEAAKIAGEKENDLPKAFKYLNRSLELMPNNTATLRLLGVANGVSKNHQEAVKFFEKVVALEPTALGYMDLSNAYNQAGAIDKANEAVQKAVQLDPNILQKK